jgi:hypothetical protein
VIGAAAASSITDDRRPFAPAFAVTPAPGLPQRPAEGGLTTSWFCPGVVVAPDGTIGGRIVVTSVADATVSGRVTVYSSDAAAVPVEQDFDVAARGTTTFDIGDLVGAANAASAMVELGGPGAVVEQQAVHPAGSPIAPCANAPQPAWYLADGFTLAGSTTALMITNPYQDDVVIDVTFGTPTDELSEVPALTGLLVPGRSIRVIDQTLMPRNEVVIGASIVARDGRRVVVGRAQHFLGEGRLGYTTSLASPVLADQWWFADGEIADGIIERFSIYNPNDFPITVVPTFQGIDATFYLDEAPLVIQPGLATAFVPSDLEGIPVRRHFVNFTANGDLFVVERAITRPAGDAVATSIVLGAPGTTSVLGTRWTIAIGVDQPLENALVLANPFLTDSTVTVKALVSGAEAPVSGLEAVVVPAGQVITVPLTDAVAVGAPLIIEATTAVFLERLFARGPDLRGRSGSFAIPG